MKIILDSNVYDKVIALGIEDDFFSNLGIEVLSTKVTSNEINETPDENKKNSLTAMKDNIKPLEVGYFGFSNNKNASAFGKGIFAGVADNEFIQSRRNKHINDMTIISLAKKYDAIFVSCDKKALATAEKKKVVVIDCNNINSREDFKEKFISRSHFPSGNAD